MAGEPLYDLKALLNQSKLRHFLFTHRQPDELSQAPRRDDTNKGRNYMLVLMRLLKEKSVHW